MKNPILCNQRGVALVLALVISAALLATALGVLFFIERSTAMSGTGMRYATADEAADGAVNLMRDTITLTMWGSPVPDIFTEPDPPCLEEAIFGGVTSVCTVTLDLPGAVGNFVSAIELERLYSVVLPGGRLEFAASGASVNPTAVFFRITSRVTGPGGVSAESSVLFRFAG